MFILFFSKKIVIFFKLVGKCGSFLKLKDGFFLKHQGKCDCF